MDLAEFVQARIAQDEETARAALAERASPVSGATFTLWEDQEWEAIDGKVMTHVDAWDPARVLAECAAKRAIVEMHRGAHECPTPDSCCGWCVDSDECDTLSALAAPYADHPDFRSEWAPTE